MVLTIAPWTARNYMHYHRFVPIESRGQEALWCSLNPLSLKFEDFPHLDVKRLPDEYNISFDTAEYASIMKLPQKEADLVFRRKTFEFVKNNPVECLVLFRTRFINYWRLFPRIATRTNKLAAKLTSGWILPMGWLGILLSLKGYWR